MPKLLSTLREQDDGILPTLAQLWGVNITNLNKKDSTKALQEAMLEPERAEVVWDILNDQQRGALQMLIASKNSMPLKMFERTFGSIRKMGRGQIEREQPHKNPASVAEGLFYRGFIFEGYEKTDKGTEPIIFVPDDLVAVLPVHKTAYKDLPDDEEEFIDVDEEDDEEEGEESAFIPFVPEPLEPVEEEYLENVHQADTSIVDDLATLLAYLRMHSAGVEDDQFLPADVERIAPYMLVPHDLRLAFMLGVGASADLITTQEGRAYPKRAGLQKWLNQTRSAQVKTLVDAWKETTLFRDMWHVPGIHPDPDAGFPYDPLLGRRALVQLLRQFVPPSDWWSIDDFIETVKHANPDFQRPGGDYDSWYIQDDHDRYLRGFPSWDVVEAGLLNYYIRGPLHWLGLADVSAEAARLTAYGRAFIGMSDWPMPPDPDESVQVQDDGTLIVSRKVSRMDRYQVARFTTWGEANNPYHYKLDAEGVQQAAAQGITTGHIVTFLKRHLGEKPIPPTIARLLDTWQDGATAEVTFERLLVLRTVAPETLDRIYNEPSLRRYLGAKLGPMACVIRAGQEDALNQALGAAGIKVEVMG